MAGRCGIICELAAMNRSTASRCVAHAVSTTASSFDPSRQALPSAVPDLWSTTCGALQQRPGASALVTRPAGEPPPGGRSRCPLCQLHRRHLVTLFPHPIPVVLGQGDEERALLQQERFVPLLPFAPADKILTDERDERPGQDSYQPDPRSHDPSLACLPVRRRWIAELRTRRGPRI